MSLSEAKTKVKKINKEWLSQKRTWNRVNILILRASRNTTCVT